MGHRRPPPRRSGGFARYLNGRLVDGLAPHRMSLNDQAAGFFHRHRARVFRYLRRAVGSADVAEDLTQDVFLKVLRGLPSYQDRQLEAAWVFRIVRRVLADHWRQPLPPVSDEAADEAAAPATQALRASLGQAIDRLHPLNREILLLREVVGLSYEEIAAALDLTLPAVRCRLARTREWLQSTVIPEAKLEGPGRAKGGSREG
jgi:RNA polymerase sigma-70 factor (ECF subfamily)